MREIHRKKGESGIEENQKVFNNSLQRQKICFGSFIVSATILIMVVVMNLCIVLLIKNHAPISGDNPSDDYINLRILLLQIGQYCVGVGKTFFAIVNLFVFVEAYIKKSFRNIQLMIRVNFSTLLVVMAFVSVFMLLDSTLLYDYMYPLWILVGDILVRVFCGILVLRGVSCIQLKKKEKKT